MIVMALAERLAAIGIKEALTKISSISGEPSALLRGSCAFTEDSAKNGTRLKPRDRLINFFIIRTCVLSPEHNYFSFHRV
jgi:hypothetical protein